MQGLNAANWLGSGHPLLKLIYIDLRYLPWKRMSALTNRKFNEEMIQFVGKKVSVETSDKKIIMASCLPLMKNLI